VISRPPVALRLVTRAQRVPAVTLPFGIRAWSSDAHAVAVLLEAEADDLNEIEVASQVPRAHGLPPATPVFILGSATRTPSRATWLSSLLRSSTVSVGRAPRCGALLMRGYVALGAGLEESSGADLVWGLSSLC
jgi:hypothetical protein